MAISSGYTYGVRKGLNDKGVDNSRISFNPNTQSVTVDGKDFMKGNKVYNGTSYTNQQGFNSAWDAFSKPQQAQPDTYGGMGAFGIGAGGNGISTGAGGAGIGSTTAQGVPTYAPPKTEQPQQQSPYTNPYDQQVADTIKMLVQQAQNPAPVDVNQIYASPQYAAAQAQQQRAAHDAIRAAQESLGSAGFGRSTVLAERSQGIQNNANEYLQTQLLPALMQQQEQAKQQQLQNQISALNMLTGQQGVYDTRQQQEAANQSAQKQANIDAALKVSQQTGRVITPQEDYSGLYRQAANPNTPLNLQGQNQQLDQQQTMANLTGQIPDGKGGTIPTTAEQQRQLGNLWTVADQTGTIPNELADMYGIPRGTQTQQAKQIAQNYALQRDQFQSGVDQDIYDRLAKQNVPNAQEKAATVSSISANIARAISAAGGADYFPMSDPKNRDQVEGMILTQTQDPVVTVQLYNMYGIPVPKELQQEYDASLKGQQ